MSSDRYVVVSADCHAGPPQAGYRPYFEQRHLADFDEMLAARPGREIGDAALAGETDALVDAQLALLVGLGMDREPALAHAQRSSREMLALFDSKRRLERLDDEGIVAEVIYPDALIDNAPPFSEIQGAVGLRAPWGQHSPELQWAGMRAYNRWLADFCAEVPGRRLGVAQLAAPYDVGRCVAELRFAAEAGLCAGVGLPSLAPGMVGWHDPALAPFWSACEELALPVHIHGGVLEAPDAHPFYGSDPIDRFAFAVLEAGFWDRRPLHTLIFGGVLERHPELRIVISEQYSDWVPKELARMDRVLGEFYMHEHRRRLSLKPSEYWQRQCFLTATFLSEDEAALRHEIGVDRIAWGSDYPHPEGTWPYTDVSLRKTFAGVARGEVEQILGGNAIDFFGFDRLLLAPLAEQLGPEVDALTRRPEQLPADYIGSGLR